MRSRFLSLCAGAAVSVFATGCIAWDVGNPVRFARTKSRIEAKTLSERPVSAEPSVSQKDGRSVRVTIPVKVEKMVEKSEVKIETTTIYRRRMSFGLFPGWAEFTENESLREGLARDLMPQETAEWCFLPVSGTVAALGTAFFMVAGTVLVPHALFVVPFDDDHDCWRNWRGSHGTYEISNSKVSGSTIGHMTPVGFHRFYAVPTHETKQNVCETWRETESGTRLLPGPWLAKLTVPSIGYDRTETVPATGTEALFEIPETEAGGSAAGVLEILEPSGGLSVIRNETDREFVHRLSGTSRSVVVSVPRKPTASEVRRGAVVTNIVVIDHAPRPEKPKERYRLHDERPYADGRATYRLEILDSSPVHELVPLVRPVVEGNVRRAFLAENPDADESVVRAVVVDQYDGDVIRFVATAYSLRPEPLGCSYDADTRRGTIRLLVSPGANIREVKAWIRANVSAVVADKNVVVEAGKAPSPRAKYRSLDENFSDGILTVEFESVQ